MTCSTKEEEKFNTATRGHSKVLVQRCAGGEEQKMTIELPFSKLLRKEFGVPSFYELCLRLIHGKLQQRNKNYCSIRNAVNNLSVLPTIIKNDLSAGPTAHCQICKCPLFRHAVVRIFDVVLNATEFEFYFSARKRTKIVLYFCSSFCSKLNDLNTMREHVSRFPVDFQELDWLIYE
jgi:hypothetical protein